MKLKLATLLIGLVLLATGCATEGYVGTTVYCGPYPYYYIPPPVIVVGSPYYYRWYSHPPVYSPRPPMRPIPRVSPPRR